MSAAALLESLSRDGVSVECVADAGTNCLKIHAPRDLKPRVLDAIRCHKSELLALLQLESASAASTRCEATTAPRPLPPSLVGIEGIEYSTSPVEALPAYVNDFTAARAFLRAVRAVVVPSSLRLTESEARQYRHVVACRECGIDPRQREPPCLGSTPPEPPKPPTTAEEIYKLENVHRYSM